MPSPSVTYTFANSTTSDATQVNQNFTDIINGLTDGTKDLSISALTCAGTATLNGNVSLGNASSDDVTVTGSLASTIAIKTNNSYNIGSATLGLAGLYLGAAGGFTTKLAAAATSSWTMTLPVTAGTSGHFLRTDGSGNTSWVAARSGPYDRVNYSLAAAVATNALTVTLNAADGNAPSATNPANIVFRNATATTGTPVDRSATGAVSIEVSSGATLGHSDGINEYVYVYAIDNSGTIELAVAGSRSFDEGSVHTTTGMGTGADDKYTLYSTTSRSNVAIRFLGRIKSNQTTAGTWAAAVSEISLQPGRTEMHDTAEIWLNTANGYGSTNTHIRRYSTTVKSIGTAMTYADSATAGMSITINDPGIYAIKVSDTFNSAGTLGISLNSTELTTAIYGITMADIVAVQSTGAAGSSGSCCAVLRLKAEDVIRAHGDAAASYANNLAVFHITKLSD